MNNRTKSIYLNSTITLICQFAQVLIGFLLRKKFIEFLGVNYLGYEAVFSNILAMLNMADLGIGVAIASFLYKPIVEQRYQDICALMHIYKKIYQVIGAIVFSIGLFVSFFLKQLIPDAQCSLLQLQIYFGIALLSTVSTYYLAYRRTLLMANQEAYIVSFIDAAFYICASMGQMYVLCTMQSYVLYLMIGLIKNIGSNLLITVLYNRKYSYIKNEVDQDICNEYKPRIKGFVKDLLVSKFGAYVFAGTDNIILSVMKGSVLAGLLSNYSMITVQIDAIIGQVLSSVQGTYGNFIHSTDDKTEQRRFTDVYLWVDAYIGIVCMVCVINMAQPFVSLFFGTEYLLKQSTVIWLGVNLFLSILLKMPYQIFTIFQLYKYDKPIIIISASLNIVVSIILAGIIGIDGVLIGTFLTSMIYLLSRLYIISKKVFKVPFIYYFKKVIAYFLIAVLCGYIIYFLVASYTVNSVIDFLVKCVVVAGLAVIVPMCALMLSDAYERAVEIMIPSKLRFLFRKKIMIGLCVCCMLGAYLIGNALDDHLGYYAQAGNKSLPRTDWYVDEESNTDAIFHLSFDDVITVFEDLNKEQYSSIFDNAELAWMKQLHDKYGVVISCYVFFEDNEFSLAECTGRYRDEFQSNSDWLRFGFHSRNGTTVYGKTGGGIALLPKIMRKP